MSVKKILMVYAGALLFMSFGPANVSANSVRSKTVSPIKQHVANVKRATSVKATHAHNLRQINRIKRHLINHQQNLIKLSKRINRLKRHRHNAALLKRLNFNKARLIIAIQHNEKGMLRLARTVANEEHQINLVRHPANPDVSKFTTVQLPKVNPNQTTSVEKSVTTIINDVNGKLTKYIAKDTSSKRNGNQLSYRQFSDVNGRYSATPDQITAHEINQLNQQLQNQIQNSNRWFNEINNELNATF